MANLSQADESYLDVSSFYRLGSSDNSGFDMSFDNVIRNVPGIVDSRKAMILPSSGQIRSGGLEYQNFLENYFETDGNVAIFKNDEDGYIYYAPVERGERINIENANYAELFVSKIKSYQEPISTTDTQSPSDETISKDQNTESLSNPKTASLIESTSSSEPDDGNFSVQTSQNIKPPSEYNSDEVENLKSSLKSVVEILMKIINLKLNILNDFFLLNNKTKEKLRNVQITNTTFEDKLDLYLKSWGTKLNEIIENIGIVEKNVNLEDSINGMVNPQTLLSIFPLSNSYFYNILLKLKDLNINDITSSDNNSGNNSSNNRGGSSNYDGITSSDNNDGNNNPPKNDDNPPVEEIKPNQPTEVPSIIIASVVGTFTVKKIVTMYEAIGNSTGIPASLTGNYVVLGIIKSDDKYYYKIVDKDANKVYYIEVTDSVEFNAEIENLLEIKNPTMMLNSTDIGTNNFVKIADQNTLYIVLNETESNDIKFYNVLDPVDGKAYFIPAGDEVQLVPINSLTSSDQNIQTSQETGGDTI